ncbi:PqqD family protein [Sphaerimonospora cavernae]|uniref:PqqD family protein n=1 Tax=Sphaerimonospora cavernae TaxID=1740611 RepID=A0ABV6U705_9ACTN
MPRLAPAEGVTFQTTDEGGILLDRSGGQLYGLNPAAAVAWNALVAGGSVNEAVAAVLNCFDVDADTARGDIERLTATLQDRGLLTSTP